MNDLNKKVAFLVTTFNRDELLYKSVQSIVDNFKENWIILIADQGIVSCEKSKWFFHLKSKLNDQIHLRELEYDCGLSYARNQLVEIANEKKCDYCVLSSDSFLFNESLDNINEFIKYDLYDKDLIGFELVPSVCGWEAKLRLIENESFELDFIEKDNSSIETIYDCDITRNIFIAKTESLSHTKWDNLMKLGEHEDFFWRYKLNNYKVGWTKKVLANKITDRPSEYAILRKKNFRDGIEKLKKKYNISGWVTYKNLERAKKRVSSNV